MELRYCLGAGSDKPGKTGNPDSTSNCKWSFPPHAFPTNYRGAWLSGCPLPAEFPSSFPRPVLSSRPRLLGDSLNVPLTVLSRSWAGARSRQVPSGVARAHSSLGSGAARDYDAFGLRELSHGCALQPRPRSDSTVAQPRCLKPRGLNGHPSELREGGKRASLLYGKGARVCDSVTPASFGGKSAAFGFLWWRAEDGLVRKAAGRVGRESGRVRVCIS